METLTHHILRFTGWTQERAGISPLNGTAEFTGKDVQNERYSL